MMSAPDKTPVLRLGGLAYRLPFAHLFRPHTALERERLHASIAERGVLMRVLTYDSPTHGNRCVIDGATRLEIAAELGRAVPIQHRGPLSDEVAHELALTLNADRRHLTPAEQQAVRAERIARVAEARARGESLRTIAEREDISREQVRRDLEAAAGVTGVTPAGPERVWGADGKSYPALPAASDPSRHEEGAIQPEEGTVPHAVPGPAGTAGVTGVTPEHAAGVSEPDGRSGSAGPDPPDPVRYLEAARAALARFRSALDQLLGSRYAPRLRQLLERYCESEPLPALDAALSDLAAEVAQRNEQGA
jgi:hypothetical protein